jgi:hypothetical protein
LGQSGYQHDPTKKSFQDLPGELRNLVYEALLESFLEDIKSAGPNTRGHHMLELKKRVSFHCVSNAVRHELMSLCRELALSVFMVGPDAARYLSFSAREMEQLLNTFAPPWHEENHTTIQILHMDQVRPILISQRVRRVTNAIAKIAGVKSLLEMQQQKPEAVKFNSDGEFETLIILGIYLRLGFQRAITGERILFELFMHGTLSARLVSCTNLCHHCAK